MGNVSEKSWKENQHTHFMFSNFVSENHDVCEIMWKNNRARQAIGDNLIWCLRIACWFTKATGTTQNMYYLLLSTATIVTRTRINFTFVRTFPVLLSL
jgi:hypothetical protein